MKSDTGTDAGILGHTSLSGARRRPRSNTRLRPVVCSVLAMFGIFGGISALFVGLVFVVLHGILAADKIFDRAGTVTLVAAIPMILIGSIFLDAIEEKNV